MAAARNGHRMNAVGDGKVLVTGGFGAGGAELATAELFNPATGTFTATGSLAHARAHHGATVLPSGEVLVTGGYGGGGVLSSTEIYDPDTNTFTAGPDPQAGTSKPCFAAIAKWVSSYCRRQQQFFR